MCRRIHLSNYYTETTEVVTGGGGKHGGLSLIFLSPPTFLLRCLPSLLIAKRVRPPASLVDH